MSLKNSKTVLIIEDDLGVNKLIQRYLKREGYLVKFAITGTDALQIIKDELNVVLLLDYNLPDMNGQELITRLSTDGYKIPFIIMTGQGDEKIAVSMMKLGAKEYIVKDANFSEILTGIVNKVFDELEAELKFIQMESELAKTEEKYQVVFENAGSAMVIADQYGNIKMVNKKFELLTGFSKNELCGEKKINDFFFATAKNEEFSFEKLEYSLDHELNLIDKQGYFKYVILTAEILVNSENNVFSIIDISKLKKMEKQLVQAKEKAENADKLKSEFLAQMSHEIRSPISTILSLTSYIKDDVQGKVSAEMLDSFAVINDAGKRVTRTIDLILNLAEVQAGVYETHFQNIDIFMMVIERLKDEFFWQIKRKGIQLELAKNTNDTMIEFDELSCLKIFTNLIENAIKFTLQGTITIKCFRNSNNKLAISVADTGVGISKEYLPIIFEPFSQEEQGYSRKFDGNGLGLALVKKYSTINNADIEIESKKGEGTKVTITFLNS